MQAPPPESEPALLKNLNQPWFRFVATAVFPSTFECRHVRKSESLSDSLNLRLAFFVAKSSAWMGSTIFENRFWMCHSDPGHGSGRSRLPLSHTEAHAPHKHCKFAAQLEFAVTGNLTRLPAATPWSPASPRLHHHDFHDGTRQFALDTVDKSQFFAVNTRARHVL
jgi:hypothetical protein